MTTTDTTLRSAWLAATAALAEARRAYDDTAADDPAEAEAAAVDAAETALDAALAAYHASDEPREWTIRTEGGDESLGMYGRREDAIDAARDYLESGDYGTITETLWVDGRIHAETEDSDEWELVTVQIDPEAPACEEGEEHDWRQTSVHGHGGGVVTEERCQRCGCRQITDTWAQRRDTGEQGLRSVEYRRAGEADDAG